MTTLAFPFQPQYNPPTTEGAVCHITTRSYPLPLLCNLFSPSRSLMLAHCSQLHPQQEPPDGIIISLQPLAADSEDTLAEIPVKRRRGRPKGSTKKLRVNLPEGKADSTHSPEDNIQRGDERIKVEANLQAGNNDGTLVLECKNCHWTFSNTRQILKHICLKEEEDEEENASVEEQELRILGIWTMREQIQTSTKESGVCPQSAFQQVFSFLQKTRLNMETLQRLRKIHGDLECQYCGKLFWYKVHYNIHVRRHTKEHSYYCSKCSYSSITKTSLMRHQIQKHSGLLLPCSSPGCKYTTPDKYKLQAHLRTHQGQENSLACPVCQHSYPEHRLKHHIKTSHPDTLPVQGKGLMLQRAEKCPYCDSYFLKNSEFQQHIWAHQGLKPYVCSVCDYAGRTRSNLKTHMNRHNTERHYLCDLCGKKFKSKVTLKSHRLSHTSEGKRFHCSECDFTSVSKPSLLRHMEQHAEYKPFHCAHCHYSCNTSGPLKRHYNLKHPNEKYENAGPGLSGALKQQGLISALPPSWEVGQAGTTQYVSVEDEEQLTEAPVTALHDNVNIQQIAELGSETHDAVTSVVTMAPGAVTVVQQVSDEQEVSDCSNQLMVVNTDGDLTGDQVVVVEDAQGLEALTVLTQGENAQHYIVYVQEHTIEIN
uniref:zinc finger protein ZFAT-like n=1 Tax=Monopterus albus TaxID=43700 RepID=UPI0009B3B854|nr:zinc finger protein ZFAT-like [Monopterus albus]